MYDPCIVILLVFCVPVAMSVSLRPYICTNTAWNVITHQKVCSVCFVIPSVVCHCCAIWCASYSAFFGYTYNRSYYTLHFGTLLQSESGAKVNTLTLTLAFTVHTLVYMYMHIHVPVHTTILMQVCKMELIIFSVQ